MRDGIKLGLLVMAVVCLPWIAIPVILLWLGLNWEPSDEECSMIITVRDPIIIETKMPITRKKKYSREDSLAELHRQLDLATTQPTVSSVWERQLKALEG